MAYNTFYGGFNQQGFQPYQQNFQNHLELIRVSGIEGARAYQMPPNSTVALFDGGSDLMYIKSTDGAGFPTIRTFAFTPQEQQTVPAPVEYVTRKEFDEFKEALKNVKQSVRRPTTDAE